MHYLKTNKIGAIQIYSHHTSGLTRNYFIKWLFHNSHHDCWLLSCFNV